MSVDDLNIRISAETADFIAGVETAEQQLDGLSSEAIQTAGALEILSNRADDAGDNVSQAGRDATTTAGQFSLLSGATSAANASFLGISATTWGSLIPAVVALSAALAPVIGALGGFVAIAASIGGLGMAGVIGAMATNGEQLKEAFNDLLPILEPLFDMATALLINFSNELEDVLGSMEIAGATAQGLMADFANLGGALINALPAFINLAVTLANEFLPPFTRWVQDILPRVPGMIRGFVDVFDRMLPRFMEAGRLIAQLLPPFTEFGFTVLEVLGPALATVAEKGTQALEFLNGLSPVMQKTAAAAALLAPAVSVIAHLFGGVLLSAGTTLITTVLAPFAAGLSTIGSVASAVGGTLLFFGNLFGMLASAILPTTGIISGLVGVVSSVAGAVSTVLGPLVTLVSVLGPAGLVAGAVLAAIGLFVMFEEEIRSAVGQVVPIISDAFNSAAAWLQSKGASLLRRGMNALGGVIRAGAIEVYNMIAKPGQSVIFQAINDVAKWLVKNGPGILNTAWNTLVDLALAAWEGFREGLIGNSIIPETINDVVDWLLSTGVSMLVNAASVVGAALLSPFEVVFNELYNLAVGALSDVVSVINEGLDVLPDEITSQLGFGGVEGLDVSRRQTDLGQTFQSNQQGIQREIVEKVARITVEDGEIVAKMEDVVNEQRQRDTTTLQANETPSP